MTGKKEQIMDRSIEQTALWQEIFEQPEAVARLLQQEAQTVGGLAQAIRNRPITHVVIAARGTSDNAARYANYVLGANNGLTVGLATPSLFSLYRKPPRLDGALVIGISQSGRSPDIVSVLQEARQQGALTAVLTNTPDSDLARQGDFVLALHAGPERAVAATKTYTTSLAAIALLSAALAGDDQMRRALDGIPDAMRRTLTLEPLIATTAPRYRYMQHCVVIGRGFNYATAFELALKLKELTYTIVEPYSSADFQHGPLAMLEQGFPVIVIAPAGMMQAETGAFITTIQARGAEVITFSDDDHINRMARIALPLPVTVPEWLSPLVAIVPGQLLAMHLAHTRDFDIDAPRGIRKITETV
jgi:glucosamine--fructose-6-phosphate aminotransferase (isomerizing)